MADTNPTFLSNGRASIALWSYRGTLMAAILALVGIVFINRDRGRPSEEMIKAITNMAEDISEIRLATAKIQEGKSRNESDIDDVKNRILYLERKLEGQILDHP